MYQVNNTGKPHGSLQDPTQALPSGAKLLGDKPMNNKVYKFTGEA
jgi:hypothetical protein